MSERIILAIDPGTTESAWVLMEGPVVLEFAHETNDEVLCLIQQSNYWLVIEDVRCYGMPIGQETLDTKEWIGIFRHANNMQAVKIPRLTVRTTLCKTTKAGDSNVRQALIDIYGGSSAIAIGNKVKPGPLYGIKKHIWSALAVGVTYRETCDD